MAYLVAIGSSDGENIDLKFGEVDHFLIYKVSGKEFTLLESRVIEENEDYTESNICRTAECNSEGCSGNGHGCGGSAGVTQKVERIADCRCVLCAKVGFQAQKQFERKAISVFDIACNITEALEKIANYYDKIDNHKSLRQG
ncbi:MAG: NifB/NifX family molybdenum-iron cluster-binding protein [Eubacteriales bacterium]|nr:NifB/NifX family molybdenum-iron cluster-binding protein [Eubacteriales bacterium]